MRQHSGYVFGLLEEQHSNPTSASCGIEIWAYISHIQIGVVTLDCNVRLSSMGESEHSTICKKDTSPKLARGVVGQELIWNLRFNSLCQVPVCMQSELQSLLSVTLQIVRTFWNWHLSLLVWSENPPWTRVTFLSRNLFFFNQFQ